MGLFSESFRGANYDGINVQEKEDETEWVISVPLVVAARSERKSDGDEFQLCSDRPYIFSDPDKTRSDMEADPRQRTKLALERGIFPFVPSKVQIEKEGKSYLQFTFPKIVPPLLRTIIRDAVSYEASRNPEFVKCRMFANLHLENEEKHDDHATVFHQDFENAREVSVYAVAERPTTVGSFDKAALGRTPHSVHEAGVPSFSILPNRMYHWSGYFIHATPTNRFDGAFANKTRPFALIGFTYE
ncbi:hypothetical protein HY417_03585 [Candidatus Kaiserbacteria bacterium]|nr:hypothetical protein [Candidatus Kaiserbacteria bacterium]